MSLLNTLPSALEDIVYDYKLDLDITSKTRKKYKKVLKELDEVIMDGDTYCNSFLRCHYMLNGGFRNYNYNTLRDKTFFGFFMIQALKILNDVD